MSYLRPTRTPGPVGLVIASVFPAVVIIIELITGLCAGAFFDPVPTFGHLLLVAAVPLTNGLLWRAVNREVDASPWLILAGGASVVISASYALLFLPILPFALVAILLLGIGLLPFGPVAAMVFAWKWTFMLSAQAPRGAKRALAGGALGLVALVLVDLPATATQIALGRYGGDASERVSAVSLMRMLGDREMLLRLSYGDTARATGIASFLVSVWSKGPFWSASPRSAEARELYYRVTGTAFNAIARPGHGPGSGAPVLRWDDDQGGEDVGGRVPDLALAGSRIDGSAAERENLAQLEWTFDIANKGQVAREARVTLALPEGAVASRATLWVNGEPREASIAGRGAARAAYQQVVSSARDPLLVTTDGAQRLLIQAFPINGQSTMRLRIGITAPFRIAPDGQRTLALPAIVERNFDMPDSLRHAVWVEGDTQLSGAARTSLTDAQLVQQRPVIGLPPVRAPWTVHAGVASSGQAPALAVTQRIERTTPAPGPLVLVVDASEDTKEAAKALVSALATIASGVPVALVVAGDAPVVVEPAPWSPPHAERVREALKGLRFRGGVDPRAAVARALAMMPRGDATMVWIHGAQPVRFARPEPALEQALERLPALARLVRYQAVPGRALSLGSTPWFNAARLPRPSGDPEADLRALLTDVAGGRPGWTVTRTGSATITNGSAGIVRLWAAGRLASEGASHGRRREAAIALAHRLNIVTPVSGAVVLETDKDYRANGLPVPDPDAVPTVPEPEVWALLILLALAGGYLIRQQRRAIRA